MTRRTISLNYIIEDYPSLFQKFGMTEENIRTHFEEWEKDKASQSTNDYLWYIFQNIIKEIAEQISSEEEIYSLNQEVYSKMVEFLIKIEHTNGNHVKRVMHFNEIKLWQFRSTFKTEIEIISGHCCEFCDSLNGKKISFEEALDQQYLASEKCC